MQGSEQRMEGENNGWSLNRVSSSSTTQSYRSTVSFGCNWDLLIYYWIHLHPSQRIKKTGTYIELLFGSIFLPFSSYAKQPKTKSQPYIERDMYFLVIYVHLLDWDEWKAESGVFPGMQLLVTVERIQNSKGTSHVKHLYPKFPFSWEAQSSSQSYSISIKIQ